MASTGEVDRVPVAGGEVSVRLYEHAIAPPGAELVHCWSYLSDGLRAFGQSEIVLTVRRTPGESRPPGDGLALVESLARAVKAGRHVSRGGLTQFGPRGFFGNAALSGLVYVPAQPLAGVDVGPQALSALTLFGNEVEVVRRFGATRLLARLGRATTYFPSPPWGERDRPPVAGDLESVLSGVAGLGVPEGSATIEGDVVVVELPPAYAPRLAEAFREVPDDRPLALHLGLGPGVPACLVWTPGQTSPEAISLPGADGSRVGACFVAFVPRQDADETLLFEDGVSAMLTDRTWAALRAALTAREPFRIGRGAGQRELAVSWVPGVYVSPFGERYEAAGGWHTYQPDTPKPPTPAGPVGEMVVVLLTAQRELGRAIDVNTLGDYVKSLEAGVRAVVADLPAAAGSDLAVEVRLASGEVPAFSFALRSLSPDTSPLRARLPPRLAAVPAPDVHGEVRFQLLVPLWGGTGTPRENT